MEEEPNENDLEEQFYSMLHYVDETQANVVLDQTAVKTFENAPRSTLRRYWRTSGDDNPSAPFNSTYQKVNTPKEKLNTPKEQLNPPKEPANKTYTDQPKAKVQKVKTFAGLPAHLSLFQSPMPKNVKKTIEIIDHVITNIVELESSDDEDEVIEVALPPKPTITIDSSDEEDVAVQTVTPSKNNVKLGQEKPNGEREVSASPVPSVVSSISDEFIRGDCIALNISSRHPDDHSFDFSLHGADFIIQKTPAKKEKRKKNKESTTPTVTELPVKTGNVTEGCFATPKSKAKNKRQRNKSYTVTEKSVPSVDVYDSDSNQSTDTNKNIYFVSKIMPSTDVYESDSNISKIIKIVDKSIPFNPHVDIDSSDSNVSLDKTDEIDIENNVTTTSQEDTSIVDLTDKSLFDNNTDIHDSIVIGNVSGLTETEKCREGNLPPNITKFGSTKVPAILYADLDFGNLKGKDEVCKNQCYSPTTLRAEMEKFYNESWGGEDFNHRELQKNMSRDKSLWAIDPKDRWPAMSRNKKAICNYCNRPGHRDDMCRQRPRVCHMCGIIGHMEPRCPAKICVNCGSPNHVYSTTCRNCARWGRVACNECGQKGHLASHCPDLWRRYHSTVDFAGRLEENAHTKKHLELYCSGCTRRGHLVHTCRVTLPFSGLPINSPYVHNYRPIFAPTPQDINTQDNMITSETLTPAKNDFRANKRQSKSPAHEKHVSKKRNISASDDVSTNSKSPARQRKMSQSQDQAEDGDEKQSEVDKPASVEDTKEAPDFIPITSTNYDNSGHVIQDNEVSDTSDVVTSARIYVTNDIVDKLKTKDGKDWLKQTMEKLNVMVENSVVHSFLSIKGKVGDQEAFQSALRDWTKSNIKDYSTPKSESDANVTQEFENNETASDNIPKNRNNILRKLSKALESLQGDLGDPRKIFSHLNYHKHKQKQLLKKKVVSSKQLMNNRCRINNALRNLNMVLLGQAGLADGTSHLKELYSLQEKLKNFRQKNISQALRNEIGEHFHTIFGANPRDDYKELLNSYYGVTGSRLYDKKNKDNQVKLSPKTNSFNPIPPQQRNENEIASLCVPGAKKDDKSGGTGNYMKQNIYQTRLIESCKAKLVFYHQRLLRVQPKDSVLKKSRLILIRKLHKFISDHMDKSNAASMKALKKMRKVQNEVRTFFNSLWKL